MISEDDVRPISGDSENGWLSRMRCALRKAPSTSDQGHNQEKNSIILKCNKLEHIIGHTGNQTNN